ncbi:TonB-dependent receptor [Alkalinema pantanalense CENA528]|uniref:TonB-dependent receptor n=1 Tax=Alkalinema pantanalense TaxID=1620705 RepID=UPI003D6F32D8
MNMRQLVLRSNLVVLLYLAQGLSSDMASAQPLNTSLVIPSISKNLQDVERLSRDAQDLISQGTSPIADGEEEITITGVQILDQGIPAYIPSSRVQRKEFETRNNRRLGDIIERMPGVVVDGPPGENNDVRLRGLDKEFTRTQIDGLTLPDGGEKREFQVNRLPSSLVESVTIIRNPTAEFESDGLAGRVDVKTRSIPERFFLEGRVGLGDRSGLGSSIFNLQLGIGDRPTEGFGYLGAFNLLTRPLDIDKFKTSTAGLRELETERQNQRYTDYSFSLGFPYKNGELTVKPLFLQLDFDKEKTKLTSEPRRTTVRNVDLEDESRTTRGISVNHKHRFGGAKLETQLGFFEGREDKDKNKREFNLNNRNVFVLNKTTLEKEDKEDQTINFNTALTIPIQTGLRQEIKLGGAFRLRDRERLKSVIEIDNRNRRSDKTGPKDNYQLEENYFAGFVQSQVFLSDRLSLIPGIRVEHTNLTASDTKTRDADKSRTDWNPSLHVLFKPTDQLSLNAAISRGINRPKFDELSPFEIEAGDKITIGNPNLDPATSLNLDIGAKYENQHFLLGANFFYRNIKDVIEEVDTGTRRNRKPIFQIQNVGDGWTSGVELEERINLGFTRSKALQGLTLWANQTFLDSELTDNLGRKRRFKEQPKFISNLGLDYTYAPWGTTFSISWTYVGDRVENRTDGSTKTITPFSFLSLAVRQKLTTNFSLFFEASNLTNAKKEEREQLVNGTSTRKVEDPGQTFLIGLDWKF